MDARSWHSSANRYYAFSRERLGFSPQISKTPPPPSTRFSRSPPSATYNRRSAPTSPIFESSALPTSSLPHRISPERYPPQQRPARDLAPSPPALASCFDSRMDEEEEEQVIRVLDNNKELVYQRDFGADERQDHDGDLHESPNSSPVKKRKLAHPNQATDDLVFQSPPMQTEPSQEAKHTPPHPASIPPLEPEAAPFSMERPLPSQLEVDWTSGSPSRGGSLSGKSPGLTFSFAGYGFETSAEVTTAGNEYLQDRIKVVSAPQLLQDKSRGDTREPYSLNAGPGVGKPSPPLTSVVTQDQSEHAREPFRERGKGFEEAPPGGGEDHGSGHEVEHGGRGTIEGNAIVPPVPPPIFPLPEDQRMNSPTPLSASPHPPNLEGVRGPMVQPRSVASSRSPSPLPEVFSAQAEAAADKIKSMEQRAEDFLQDIHKEFLSKTEAPISFQSVEVGVIPGFPIEGDASVSLLDRIDPLPDDSTPILDGMSPLTGIRFVSPLSDIDHHDITFDAFSISSHTPISTTGNLPDSIARSTSFAASDSGPNDTLLEVDPALDQITKQALGDLIVHSLKLNYNLDANEGNSDVLRRRIKLEVDKHAKNFLTLAAKLARRMDSIGELRESTEVPAVEPNQLMVERILPDMAENGYLEYLPPSDGAVGDEQPPPCEEDTQHAGPDVEMGPVPPGVSHSDSAEQGAEQNDEPAGKQDLNTESTNGDFKRVDHVDSVEPADGGDAEEPGLEIPGVWCAHTGKDRTDTIQEHIEVSEVLAARVKKWTKKNCGSGDEPGRGPVAMSLMCLQTSVMQELYASFEDGARPVGEFFAALKALRCTWPTGGKLMIQVKAGEPERTRTWFSHQLVQGKPLDISSVIHPGRVTLQFVQLADLSNYVFLLLVSEPGVMVSGSPTNVGGSGGGGSAAESKSKVDEYLSMLEFSSGSS